MTEEELIQHCKSRLAGYKCPKHIVFWEGAFRTAHCRRKEAKALDQAMKLLGLVGLESWQDTLAGTLPHAHQKIPAATMALAAGPKLLLLDEPLEGNER